jgi:hypothetical protein
MLRNKSSLDPSPFRQRKITTPLLVKRASVNDLDERFSRMFPELDHMNSVFGNNLTATTMGDD